MNGLCYDIFMSPFEKALGRARADLLEPLSGSILEIGSGTGANFGLYSRPTEVTAIEPDPDMMRRSEALRPNGMTLLAGTAEALPMPSDSFDHVVSTFVFCSVHDTTKSIEEIIRVARPSARLHLIEHVKGVGLPGKLHELFTPLWSRICGGCHLNRKTLPLLEQAGFELEERRVLLNFIGTPFVLARLRVPKRPPDSMNVSFVQ